MARFILILLFILAPTTSESQTIKAKVGKKNIYLEFSGKIFRSFADVHGPIVAIF